MGQTSLEISYPEWAQGDHLLEWYATEVWGRKACDDDALFEVMSLQVFQAGLNWRMILARRDAFRKAFQGWQIARVSRLGLKEIDQLLMDPSIIRNKKKIQACVDNAQTIRQIQIEHRSFCNWFYEILPGNDLAELQKILRMTFKFMGPEIARMWLMASGRIPDNSN